MTYGFLPFVFFNPFHPKRAPFPKIWKAVKWQICSYDKLCSERMIVMNMNTNEWKVFDDMSMRS